MKKIAVVLLVANSVFCADESATIRVESNTKLITTERNGPDAEPSHEFMGFVWGSAATSRRIENGVLRRREDGELLDGGLVMQYVVSRGHYFWAEAATDYAAEDPGTMQYDGGYLYRQEYEGLALGEVCLRAGYSNERYFLADTQVLLGPIHAGYGREHDVDAYRLGLGTSYRFEDNFTIRLTFDRVVIYAEGTDAEPHLATEGDIELAVNVGGYFVAFAGGGFVHDALGDLDGGQSWQVRAGIAMRLW